MKTDAEREAEGELNISPKTRAIGIFSATTLAVLMHSPLTGIPSLEEYLRFLPGGLKLFGCYVVAHKAYLAGDYSRALGIAETADAYCEKDYVIPKIYIHIISAVAHINMMQIEKAKAHMRKAWEMAEPDNFIQPFIEHHALLQGLLETTLKKDDPAAYEKIAAAAQSYRGNWVKMHNELTKRSVADNLTTTEFTIAMLYNRGWRIKEIAAHMELSERTIKNYLQVVYEKLSINGKKELEKYMLQ